MSGARRPLVIGVSLKLYLDIASSARWAASAAEIARRHPAVGEGRARLFVLPSLPALPAVRDAIGDAPIAVGAQDLFWLERGAYTGGVSGDDLRDAGATLVEVGHDERRRIFGDDDRIVNLKTAAAFRTGLTPVLCVGEEHDGDPAVEECVRQLRSALDGVPPAPGAELIVAYEPRWAIGADAAAAPDHVARVIGALRAELAGHPWLSATSVIYGGSAGPGVLTGLGTASDGLFLGRFAHDPEALERVLDETMAVT